MNDNTILRIKVPAHLYESVKEQLTLTEAKKQNYGAGYSVVKEKKVKVPKDGMEKVEEDKGYMGTGYDSSEDMAIDMIKKETKHTEMEKKTRSLEELKKAKTALDKKIQEMEGGNENVKENVNEDVTRGAEISANNMMNAISSGDPFATGVALVLGVAGAVIAGANAGAIKNTLVGWWKGLKDEKVKEKIKDFADENNVKLG
jgi:hypothetical protein